MADARRCDLTDLPVDGCAHCRGHTDPDRYEQARRSRLLDLPGVVAARYPGRCAVCEEPYAVGAPIRRADRPLTGWAADCCIEETPL